MESLIIKWIIDWKRALDADLIILAVPVDQTEKIVVLLADMDLKSHVIVTDAGSTKGTVVEAAKRLDR